MSAPGPHVFLLVIKLGVRFTEEERNSVQWIQENFGKEALLRTIILFTHTDLLKGTSLKEYIKKSHYLPKIVDSCGGRYHSVNNEDRNNQHQITELLQKMNALGENGIMHYTPEMFRTIQTEITGKGGMKKPNIIHILSITILIGVIFLGTQQWNKEDKLKNEIQHLEKKVEQLIRMIEDSKQEEKQLRNELSLIEEYEKNQKNKLEEIEHEEMQLRKNISQNEEDKKNQKNKLKATEKEEKQLKDKLPQTDQEEVWLDNELQSKEELQQLQKKLQQEENDYQLEQQLLQKEEERIQQKHKLLDKKKETFELTKKLLKLNQEKHQIKNELVQKEQEKQELQNKIQQKEHENKNLEKELEQEKNEKEQLENKLSEYKQTLH
ncbi:hypothetical protein QQF64_023582 [Cirrhinus molitorella]|uniref:AIG1-type G domain-containing protein n=1 Tax=Cirrhinus molitorella TaxID=172907 RepID=A0ABR3NJ26_9TELE